LNVNFMLINIHLLLKKKKKKKKSHYHGQQA
jgi:hypothetical protein